MDLRQEWEPLVRQIVRSELQAQRRERRGVSTTSYPDDFLSWVRGLALRFKGLYGVFVAIPGLVAITTYLATAFHLSPADWLKDNLPKLSITGRLSAEMLIQSLIVFILYWLIPSPGDLKWEKVNLEIERKLKSLGFPEHFVKSHNGKEYQAAHRVAKEFATRWEFAWLSWALLYLVWGSAYLVASIKPGVRMETWLPFLTLLFNLNTLAVYLCYRQIVHPSVSWDRDQRKKFYGFLLVILAIFSLQFIGAKFVDPGAAVYFPLLLTGKILGVIVNFSAGASLALMIGRLESRLISPPTPIIYIMYMYAVMQGVVLFAEGTPELLFALSSLALCLKIVLYMLIAWLLDSNMLTFYLAEIKLLERDGLKEERKAVVSSLCLEGTSRRSQWRPLGQGEDSLPDSTLEPREIILVFQEYILNTEKLVVPGKMIDGSSEGHRK